MLIEMREPLGLGNTESAALLFGETEKPTGSWAGRRVMWNGDKEAFELSFWCGTCPLLFQRLEGSTETFSLPHVQETLNEGFEVIDDGIVDTFAELLPHGTYIPMLLRVQPTLVLPGRNGDYFSEDQVATWGLNGFWGLPEHPQTPYYRTWQTPIDGSAHVFEFVVPMVPPSWNEHDIVKEHAQRLRESSSLTAVAVSILDVCQPATAGGSDYYAHWGLTHFLLDGHHKMQAAAETGRPLQILSLLSVDGSLADRDEIGQLIKHRSRPAAKRSAL
jgi:hypothetical protein